MNTLTTRQHNRLTDFSRYFIAFCLAIICFLTAAESFAKSYSFAWSANPEPVEGYRLYYKKGGDAAPPFNGTDASEGVSSIDLGKQTSFTINGLEDNTTYHFALTAYNGTDESGYSEIITVSPSSTPSASPPTTGGTAFTFSWEYPSATDIVAYRFYLNDQKLCESTSPSDNSITCYAGLLNTVMSFSMSSVDSLGAESARSNILILDPANYPELFARKATTFSWEYDATAATTVSGFKIYQNDVEICATSDPSVRQLTCNIMLAESNVFRVSAIESSGTDTAASNSIVYTMDSTSSPETLAAIINTTGREGAAPLSLTFNGTASTGAISSYSWSFGDGNTATGATVSHIYQTPGAYTATLAVTDADGMSQSANVVITVTDPAAPPVAYTPPTAAISSSSAVGTAPFTIQFDGSGSAAAQPPIASYSWDFGDGSSAQGATASHTFTVPGTYQATLTVTDSVGLTGQASTPVIIASPPVVVENQPPVSAFTAATTSGKAPLAVSFNAAGSKDPDGTISQYLWSFGDGSAATGVTAQHTFIEVGDYTVSLEVTDNQGKVAVSSQTVSVLADDKVNVAIEVGEIQADHNWTSVTFKKPFINPVVIAGPPSFADTDPATIRIRNVTSTGFDVRIEEWNYLDGKHAPETFSFIVMEKGVFTLDNGTKVEVGTFNGSAAFQEISLQQSYNIVPVILTQVMTINEADTVTGRLRNSTQSSFEYTMQEQEKNKPSHASETIGYIAWEPGKGTMSGLLYEAGLTTKSVTHAWFDLTFQSQFPNLPLFVAGMQTYTEKDPAAVRALNLSRTATQVKIEDEKSKDAETSHAAETVGYLTIGAP